MLLNRVRLRRKPDTDPSQDFYTFNVLKKYEVISVIES